MSNTLNDHLRNLIDEIPGVQARDFIKAWNREQRAVCQTRRWRELREEIQFTIGASSVLGTATTSLPYSTGTVSGTAGSTTIAGSGTAWLGAWNGLNSIQIVITGANPAQIYDVTAVDNGSQELTVYPALKETIPGYPYRLFFVPAVNLSVGTGREMMGVRWLGKLGSTTDRSETILKAPDDYVLDRTILESDQTRFYHIELRDSGNTGDFVLHYYVWPKNISSMGETILLPSYVQDVIYLSLLKRYIGRTPMDIQTKNFIYGDAKNRWEAAWKAAKSADETIENHQGVNQQTIWIPDR